MATFDLTPLYHATVGFDRVSRLLGEALERENAGFPRYNIEKTGDDAYRITLAVAGFADAELSVEVRDGQLLITGRKAETDENANILHRGIATRAFERRFQLADHVRVVDALTENGLLHVSLVREVPEALKPRSIPISTAPQPKAIEQETRKAA
jgi:molecular chaperone IbpA